MKKKELKKLIEELTKKETVATIGVTRDSEGLYPIGSKCMIRTVTMIYIGEIVHVTSGEIVLVKASWVASTGEWSDFIAKGEIRTSSIYPSTTSVIVNRGAITDSCAINWELPKTDIDK